MLGPPMSVGVPDEQRSPDTARAPKLARSIFALAAQTSRHLLRSEDAA
jgi:hypothetical protein